MKNVCFAGTDESSDTRLNNRHTGTQECILSPIYGNGNSIRPLLCPHGKPQESLGTPAKADEYDTPNTFLPYRVSRLQAYAEYYRARKEYEKALESLDNAITLTLQMSFPDAILYMAMKADILVDMGHPEVAINIYRKVMRDKDSLYRGLSNAQMEQIQSLYNMDKLVLKREQQQEKIHYFVLIVIGIALLALIAFVIHMYFSRKRLQKDEKEMARLSEIAEEANEVKSRFLANMSYNIRIPLNNVVGFSQLLSTDMGLDDKENWSILKLFRQILQI